MLYTQLIGSPNLFHVTNVELSKQKTISKRPQAMELYKPYLVAY